MNIQDIYGMKLEHFSLQVTMPSHIVLTPVDEISVTALAYSFWVFILSMLPLFLTLICARQLAKIWNLIDVIQFFTFMRYLNLNLPFNLKEYLGLFDIKRFAFLPNFMQIGLNQFSVEYTTNDAEDGFATRKTFFLFNNSVLLSYFLLTQLIFLVALFMTSRCSKSNNWFIKKCQGIKKSMVWNGYFRFVMVGILKITIFGFLQIIDLNFDSVPNTISSVVALMGILVVLAFPCVIFYIILKVRKSPNSFDNTQTKQHYGGLYQIYRTDSLIASSFAVVRLMRKLIFAFCLVFLQKHQTLQLGFMTLNNFAYFLLIVTVQPFKSSLQNKVARVTELFFSVGLLLMITYSVLEDSISPQTYKSIG